MKMFLVLEVLMIAFASNKNVVEHGTTSVGRMEPNTDEQSSFMNIEDAEYPKAIKKGDSTYIGAVFKESRSQWEAHRWSENEKRLVYSGYYKDEETAAHASDALAKKLIANGEKDHRLNFPYDESEEPKDEGMNPSIYIGVTYFKRNKTWGAQRWGKKKKNMIFNGTHKDEETAARASDTLARKLTSNGEKDHKLNFPDDLTEVHAKIAKRCTISKYIGVQHNKTRSTWSTRRWSKLENKVVYYGAYRDEETAAHASDTLARTLIANGEKSHRFNFPDDDTEVHREKKTRYIGVHYNKRHSRWAVQRWSKKKKRLVYSGHNYEDVETAAHASDSLARKLIADGEECHKLNFPDNATADSKEANEVSEIQKKRKRENNSGNSQGNAFYQI